MSDGSKKSQGLDRTPRLRLASKDAPPTLADLQLLLKESKQRAGTAVEWHWKTRVEKRNFTLSARIVPLDNQTSDDEYYEYEDPDEPLWLFKDDRTIGNNIIWQQRTTDFDLILSIIQTHNQYDSQEVTTVEVKPKLTDDGKKQSTSTPVFSDLINVDEAGLLAMGHQPLHAAIRSFAVNLFTGRVDITKNLESAYLFFDYGVPVHASTGSATGDIALVEMMSWHMGVVSYQMDERSIARSVTKSIEWLISEGTTLFEQKKFLGRVGLSYESSLVKTGKQGGQVTASEDLLLKKKILNHLSRPCTVTDMLRDLQIEVWEWVPSMFHLFNQGQVTFEPPEPERSSALKFLNGAKPGAEASPLLSDEPGMYKYEALMIFLAREFQRFKEHGRIFSVVLFDIKGGGNTKRLRELTPDTVTALARKVDLLKRPVDIFAHFDMDAGYYALLLPDTDVRKSTILARCIHQVLGLSPLNAEEHGISVACGIAGLPEHGNDLESLIAAAKQAMELARKTRVPILVGQRGALLSKPTTGSGPAYVTPVGMRTRSDADAHSISLEDLLVRAQVISRDGVESAIALSRQMHTPLSMVLTMSGIDLSKKTVSLAEYVHSLIAEKELTVEEGVSILTYIGNQDITVDAALKKLGLFKRQSSVTSLGKLLADANLVEEHILLQATSDSARTGLTLGYLLVTQELISRSTLHAALNVLRLSRNESFNREDGVRALKVVGSGSKSFKEFCHDNKISMAPIEAVGLGEILMMAEIITESELMTAREIALSGGTDLQGALLQHGFATDEYLSMARQYRDKIESGSLTAEEATEKLKRTIEMRNHPGRLTGDHTLPGRADSSLASGAHGIGAPKISDATRDRKDADTSKSTADRPGYTTLQGNTPVISPVKPKGSGTAGAQGQPGQTEHGGGSQGGARVSPERQLGNTRELQGPFSYEQIETPPRQHSVDDAPVESGPEPSTASGGAPPARPERSKVPVDASKGVDRVDLLRFAGLVDDQQVNGARKLATNHGTSPIRILFDRGFIDQDSLNLAAAAKRKIDAGEIDVKKAVRVIIHCKKNRLDFDAGASQVE